MACRPDCTVHVEPTPAPEEPPVGTRVTDRLGAQHVRTEAGWARQPDGPAFGRWEAMWDSRGPLAVL